MRLRGERETFDRADARSLDPRDKGEDDDGGGSDFVIEVTDFTPQREMDVLFLAAGK